MEGSGILPPPPQMKPNPKRKTSNEYCKYHKAKGHDTSECWQLKSTIEDAIRRGYLKQYIDHYSSCKTERPSRRRRTDDDDDDEREEGRSCENARQGGKDERTDQPRGGDRDKNCYGEINTIIGGPVYNRNHEPSPLTSDRGRENRS